MDYAEQLESVAYVICGENSKITFKNFSEIWHARGVSKHESTKKFTLHKISHKSLNFSTFWQILDKLYRLIDVDGTNSISTNQIMEFISHLTNLR